MDTGRNVRLNPNHPILETKYRYEIPSAGARCCILANQIKGRQKDNLAYELVERETRINREILRSKWEESDECNKKWVQDRHRERNRHLHLLEKDFLKARRKCLKRLLDCEQEMYEKELAEMGYCVIKN